MDVHEKLRDLMSQRGWTAYRLARECGLSEATIANVIRRNANPSLPTLEAICTGFGITLSQFFAESEMVELSPELKALFDGWVTLSAEQKQAVLQMVSAFNKSNL